MHVWLFGGWCDCWGRNVEVVSVCGDRNVFGGWGEREIYFYGGF